MESSRIPRQWSWRGRVSLRPHVWSAWYQSLASLIWLERAEPAREPYSLPILQDEHSGFTRSLIQGDSLLLHTTVNHTCPLLSICRLLLSVTVVENKGNRKLLRNFRGGLAHPVYSGCGTKELPGPKGSRTSLYVQLSIPTGTPSPKKNSSSCNQLFLRIMGVLTFQN